MPEKSEFNKYENLPVLSYNCISYMIDNNDLIWRLLKYNDRDAWRLDANHLNLTKEEKGSLVYAGQEDDTSFRIFMDIGNDNAWTHECCFLRITPLSLVPSSYVLGRVTMSFEIYCHYKINTLSNYQTRLNIISQQLLECFNGQEVGGLGKMFFDYKSSTRSRMQLIGKIPYKGNAIIMTNWM
jgi:hypothetical protein